MRIDFTRTENDFTTQNRGIITIDVLFNTYRCLMLPQVRSLLPRPSPVRYGEREVPTDSSECVSIAVEKKNVSVVKRVVSDFNPIHFS